MILIKLVGTNMEPQAAACHCPRSERDLNSSSLTVKSSYTYVTVKVVGVRARHCAFHAWPGTDSRRTTLLYREVRARRLA